MDLWDIAKSIGSGLLQTALPGVGTLIIKSINDELPKDKKLPVTATGDDALTAIKGLSPDRRADLMDKEFDVQITDIKETNETLRVMLDADATSTHTTRPKIAYQAFQVVASISLITIFLWAYAVGSSNDKMVKVVMDGWPFVVGIVSPFIILLHAYFGVLKQEHKNRLDAAGGLPTDSSTNQSAIMGTIAKLLNR